MRKIYILATILFFNSIIINAQGEDVLDPTGTGLTGFLIVDNYLYYTQSDDIFKLDITDASPTPTLIINGLGEPTGLLLNGNDLYFAQATGNKVSKIDITAATPTIIDVVTGLNEPTFLALNGNDLYISEIATGKIIKADITASLPTTTTDVALGLITPLDLELIGNDLYITEPDGNKVSKIDITASLPTTPTNVVTGLNKPLQLTLNGNDLYIIEKNGNKISKINITVNTPAVDVITGLDSPEAFASNSTHLYFSENSSTAGFARIARVSFASLSIDENKVENKVTLFPNPSKNILQVNGLVNNEAYGIYSILGTKIMSGLVSNNEDITIENLANGHYFLKFENGNTLKFVKE